MIFFLFPVVDSTTVFHLIDQRKMGYLYHLQILLFNLQDSLSLLNNDNTMYLILLISFYDQHNLLLLLRNNDTAVTTITANYGSNKNTSSYDMLDADKMVTLNTNALYTDDIDEISFTAVLMTTSLYGFPSYDIDADLSAVSVANEATLTTVMMTTQVCSSPSSLSTIVTMMTDNINTAVYFAVIDAESSAAITMMTTSADASIDGCTGNNDLVRV